jgi:hypothetical protein
MNTFRHPVQASPGQSSANNALEPTPVDRISSAFAEDIVSPARLNFIR